MCRGAEYQIQAHLNPSMNRFNNRGFAPSRTLNAVFIIEFCVNLI